MLSVFSTHYSVSPRKLPILAIGTECSFDGTPLKIYADEVCQTFEIYVRSLPHHNTLGSPIDTLPLMSRPSSQTALGLMGCLKLEDMKFERSRAKPLLFHYIYLRFDGAVTNGSILRYICAEAKSDENLLVARSVCWDHTFSRSVVWSLGDYNYGAILRTCHVLDSKRPFPLIKFVAHCLINRIALEGTTRSGPLRIGDFRPPSWHAGNVDTIWSGMPDHIIARNGPFTKTNAIHRLHELKKLVASVYPQGVPRVGELHKPEFLEKGGLFLKFLPDVFK